MTTRYLRTCGLAADHAVRLHELKAESGVGQLPRTLAEVASQVADSKNATPLFARGMRLIVGALAAVVLRVGAKENTLQPDDSAALVEDADR